MAISERTSTISTLGLQFSIHPEIYQVQPARLDATILSNNGNNLKGTHFWLERVTYNLLHLKSSDKSLNWSLGGEYLIHFFEGRKPKHQVSVRVSYANKKTNRIGLRVLDCTGKFKFYIGQLILENSASFSPNQLYKLQFPVESVKKAITFKTVTSPKEYEDVISLRNKAYRSEGKIGENKILRDQFDDRSIIVIAIHQSKVVGSLRMILNSSHEKFEHEYSLVIPSYFPKKDDIIEITRVCTHPDYRHSDLLEGLFQYSSYIAMNHGRNWIIGSSTDGLLPLYEKLGFKIVPIVFEHKDFLGIKHTLFYANKYDIIFGRKVSPFLWSIMYKDLYDFSKKNKMLHKPSLIDNIRIYLYKALGYVVKKIRKHFITKRMNKFNIRHS